MKEVEETKISSDPEAVDKVARVAKIISQAQRGFREGIFSESVPQPSQQQRLKPEIALLGSGSLADVTGARIEQIPTPKVQEVLDTWP